MSNAPQEKIRERFELNVETLRQSMDIYKEVYDEAFGEPVTAFTLFEPGVAELIADTGGLRPKLNCNAHGYRMSYQEVRSAVERAKNTFDLSLAQDKALKSLFTALSKHRRNERARDHLP